MFSFLDYTNEIFMVAKENGVEVGVAYDQFRADVATGKALPYNTGSALSGFDFAAAKAEWDKLTKDAQSDACAEWQDFLAEYYTEVCAAFAEGEDAVIALVEEWRDE
ncbi:MAG: hypothetical protein VB064_04780 [Oscillospiraceae bacterium]|nr:hypothetical protein [Oscillospiraceae bacterium]